MPKEKKEPKSIGDPILNFKKYLKTLTDMNERKDNEEVKRLSPVQLDSAYIAESNRIDKLRKNPKPKPSISKSEKTLHNMKHDFDINHAYKKRDKIGNEIIIEQFKNKKPLELPKLKKKKKPHPLLDTRKVIA